MNIRVVIVDDEPLARLAVKARLARRGTFELVGEFGDGASAYEGIVALKPDLVFVDVEMPGKSGLDVLAALPPALRPMAILLTAYEGFALQAFELAALDYLLKPVDDERFDEALDRAQQAFPYRGHGRAAAVAATAVRSFSVRIGSRTVLVPVAEVERIEADGDTPRCMRMARPGWCVNVCTTWPCSSIRASSTACTARPSCGWT